MFAFFIIHQCFGKTPFGKFHSFDMVFQHGGGVFFLPCPAQNFVKGGDDAVGDIFGTHKLKDLSAVGGNGIAFHAVESRTGHGVFNVLFNKFAVFEHVAPSFSSFVVELAGSQIPGGGGLGDHPYIPVFGGKFFTDVVPETCVV